MEAKLSHRAMGVKPSPTLAIAAQAAALRAAGKDILSLATGEPDFDTPEHAKDAAIKAIGAGFTKYTPVDGTPELKEAVIEKFQRDNGLTYAKDEILVSCGCKHSIYNLTQAVLDPGDEAIIPAPYWVSYPDMVRLAGAEPVIIKTDLEHGFKITPEQINGVIGDKTRLIILNSPSNPTGASYSAKELTAIGKILREHPNVLIATDDIYEHILWTGEGFKNILNVCPEFQARTVVLNGVSKAYAMTGWRIGYAAGPKRIIQAMKKIQSQSTTNPASISQVAAQAALQGDQELLKTQCKIFKERHDFVDAKLNAMPGVKTHASSGTFYTFPNVQQVISRLNGVDNDLEFAAYLLDKVGIAVVPGSAFGAPGYLRLSFATSMEVLEDAMERMAKAIND